MRAKICVPAVWGKFTTYNGQCYAVGPGGGPAMVKMYHDFKVFDKRRHDTVKFHEGSTEMISSEVNITVFPNHLASASMSLLSGKDGDDFVRILFLPDTDQEYPGPPEVKFLRVTLNQILAKLEEPGTKVTRRMFMRETYGDTSEEECSDEDVDEAEADAGEDSWETTSDSDSDF